MKKLYIEPFIIYLIIVLDYIMAIMPSLATIINISNTLLLISVFLLKSFFTKISYFNLSIGIATVFLIILCRDVTRISLFAFCIFLDLDFLKNKKIVKNILILNIVCMMVIYIAYKLGFNQNYDTQIWRPLYQTTFFRKSFGFTHPNQFMIYIFNIFALLVLYKNSVITNIVSIIGVSILYIGTKSRTVFFIVLTVNFIFLLINVYNNLRNKKKEEKYYYFKSILFIVPIFLFISFILSMVFANTFLDNVFSGRLEINKYMILQGVKLLGNNYLEDSIFDNSYLHILLSKGIIYFVLYSIVFYKKFTKIKLNFTSIIILFSIFSLAFMEVCLMKNPIFLLLAILKYNNLSKQKYV